MQEYKITILRDRNGMWCVRGYWEVPNAPMDIRWDLDGTPKYFKSRKEALEFCLKQTGIPE